MTFYQTDLHRDGKSKEKHEKQAKFKILNKT